MADVNQHLRTAALLADGLLTAFRESFKHGDRMKLTLVVRFEGAPDDAAMVMGDDMDVERVCAIVRRMVRAENEVIHGSRLGPKH